MNESFNEQKFDGTQLDPEKKKILEDKVFELKNALNKIEKKVNSQQTDLTQLTIVIRLLKEINTEVRLNTQFGPDHSMQLINVLNNLYLKLITKLESNI